MLRPGFFTWAALVLLLGGVAAHRLTHIAQNAERPKFIAFQAPVHLDEAYTLLDTGRLFSAVPDRVDRVMEELGAPPDWNAYIRRWDIDTRNRLRFEPWPDIGPWLRVPETAPVVLTKEFFANDHGLSLLIAATWAALGTRTADTALYWLVPAELLHVLAVFVITRRLSGTVPAFLAAIWVAASLLRVGATLNLTNRTITVYGAMVLAALVVMVRGRHLVGIGIAVGVLTVALTLCRITSQYVWMAVVLGLALRFGWRRAVVPGAVAFGIILLASAGIRTYTERHETSDRDASHPIWHTLYSGLGDFPNPYGYVYSDFRTRVAVARLLDHEPAPHSDEYRQATRQLFLTAVRERPGWYALLLLKRVGKLLHFRGPDTVEDFFFAVTGGWSLHALGLSAAGALGVAVWIVAWRAATRRDDTASSIHRQEFEQILIRLGILACACVALAWWYLPPPPGLATRLPTLVPGHWLLTGFAWIGIASVVWRRDRAGLAVFVIFAYYAAVAEATTVFKPQYYLPVTEGLLVGAAVGWHQAFLWCRTRVEALAA